MVTVQAFAVFFRLVKVCYQQVLALIISLVNNTNEGEKTSLFIFISTFELTVRLARYVQQAMSRWQQPILVSSNLTSMKFIYCLLFSFFATDILYGQNCDILDNKLFFSSIRFGSQIPDDLFLCSKRQKLPSLYYTGFRIEYDSLNQDCKNRYSDLFSFLKISSSFSQISINKKGQIVLVDLYTFFDDNHVNDSTTYEPPVNFTDTYNKLISLYGKPTRTEDATGTDSLLIKDLGMPKLIAWECNNIFLILKVRYGSRSKAVNVLDIQIANKQFDLPEQEELEQ